MKLFVITLMVLGIIYGGVTTTASAAQLKSKDTAKGSLVLMALGGVLVLSSLIMRIMVINADLYTFYMLLGGLVTIHVCAIVNGYKLQGSINPKHHIVRLGISVLLVAVFLLY